MIYLYTGLNGAGKTSSCLYDVLEVLSKSPRPFFASGINWTDKGREKYGVQELSPEEWVSCPEGSVILLDEAQNSMPARPNTKDLPDWINALGTHRHKGLDIFMTTPHPMQIDVFARRLVGVHRHYKRAFGFGRVTRLENEGVMSDPTSRLETHQAQVKVHALRRQVYPYYVSASMHTHKARVPWSKALFGLGVVGAMTGAALAGVHVWNRMHQAPAAPGSVVPRGAGGSARVRGLGVVSSSSGAGVGRGGGGGSTLQVAGSMSMGGKRVYLVVDSSGVVHLAKDCRVVHDAPMCRLGGSLVTYPDVAVVQ